MTFTTAWLLEHQRTSMERVGVEDQRRILTEAGLVDIQSAGYRYLNRK